MVTTAMENEIVYDKRMSSVVPGRITRAVNVVRDLKNMDLAMKLHYITGVYLFDKDAAQGLRIADLKRPMFNWLELYHPVAGRIRRAEKDEDGRGRLFIKCNDSGVRIVEAKCSKTLREWLSSAGRSFDHLVYDHVLGPDLGFSPLVFVQFTWFRCGGISVGLSWSHILGDVFSATDFMNTWGKILANDQAPSMHLAMPCTERNGKTFSSLAKVPYSIKMVDPVGDHWQTTNNCRMQSHSFHFTAKHLKLLLSKASETSRDCNSSAANLQMKPFEVISAVIWKSLAKIRAESEPKIVTICKKDSSSSRDTSSVSLSNSQVISTVEAANLKVSDADFVELANLIAGKQEDERSLIEELIMESDHCQKGQSDYIMYGAKLTFVDLEGSKIYDLELNGHKPLFANYSLNGVGEEGAVVVLPTTTSDYNNKEGERMVNLILPENLIEDLKNELRNEWSIF